MSDTFGEAGSVTPGGVVGGLGEEIALSMPRKSAHDMYLMKAYNTLMKFDGILFSMASYTDPRVVPYTRQCITIVLDDVIRDKMFAALAAGLDYVKTSKDLDPASKGDKQIEVCQRAIAQVNSYLDEFIGLAKTNALVPLASVPDPAEVAAAKEILDREGDLPEESTQPDADNTAHEVDAPDLCSSSQDENGGDREGTPQG